MCEWTHTKSVSLNDDVLLVLASALALRTKWALPFNEYPRGERRWLSRADHDLESVRVYDGPAGPLTVVTVVGTGSSTYGWRRTGCCS